MDEERTRRDDDESRRGLIRGHFATFVGTNGRVLARHVLAQVAFPLAGAAVILGIGSRFSNIGDMIAGFAVLAGFLFGLVIFVFQLRLGMSHDPRVQEKVNLPTLIDQLFANVLYAVFVSFVLTLVAIAVGATEGHDRNGTALGVEPWMAALITVIGLHLLAVVLMCLKRTRTAYVELKR